ncbi:uncharacterized protein LTR77_000204 [Saxophila tyrrhenica]|uniref:Uncharacterized protein n=1 Tax=Saxophila tyrrhenica TaxID=1690608 RepID=A0AAV9PMK5_9PEZI|nr:hypothetical protein LTR77_000204 [Saxophila tyrrhenica]
MNHHQALRLTPSNSPFFKASTPRSPTKLRSEESGLRLKKVIGTTTASANGFDFEPSTRQFAYTAGATAVVCTVEEDLTVKQRFFRARPTSGAGSREVNGHGPISPTPTEARNRVLGGIRDGMNGSPLGASARDWSDSPGGKSATAKDRVKAATSVALSPNGKWVAMGETGYKPRILIFANKSESSESPVCALSEHTFGVHALAFSPNSRYLASLGTVNDGFLYIWTIDDRTGAASLHSSNKCTVFINRMIWVGQTLVTVGLRFVKCWRPADDVTTDRPDSDSTSNTGTPRSKATDFGNSILGSRHRVLPGKNSLLGDMIDANFVTALALTDDKAIVCADSGEICTLSDCHNAQTLTATAQVDFRITAASINDSGYLCVAGPAGKRKDFSLEDLGSPSKAKADRRQTISPFKLSYSSALATTAFAPLGDVIVELDSRRNIRLSRPDDQQDGNESTSHQLAAHNETVLAVRNFGSDVMPSAAFLTASVNGSIRLWAQDGEHVAELSVPVETSSAMYDVTNELKSITALSNGRHIAAGDKYGTLSLLEVSSRTVTCQVRSHTADVVDIASFERVGKQLIASASRDRTIQLFEYCEGRLDLLQTLEEHAAAVSGLLATQEGNLLLSCSTDRSVVVREAVSRVNDPDSVAYTILRTISLKSSPTSMCLKPDSDEILVSTVDRTISAFNCQSGRAGFSFKCSDGDGGEAAVMSKVTYAPSLNGNPIIVGVSSSDKSVRLYSEYGSLLARDWGHTEGITDVCLLMGKEGDGATEQSTQAQLITVAADSTVFIWDTCSPAPKRSPEHSETNGTTETPSPNKLSTPIGPPLRKVLSFSELSGFKRGRSVDDGIQASPSVERPAQPPPSPPRLKKKTSRITMAQPPKLEPPFNKSSFGGHKRRSSLRKRSPSPPSPRGTVRKEVTRKPSLGMSLRSKSSENVLTTASAGTSTGFGSLNASTESVCRTLRAYRKKLATSSSSSTDNITPETLRELEKELKLTARVVGEKSHGKSGVDEAMMARLLDQASDRIVSRLDERIKEKVESEVRRSSEASPLGGSFGHVQHESIAEEEAVEAVEAVAGALEKVELREG